MPKQSRKNIVGLRQKDFLGMPIGDITSGGLYLESKGVIPQMRPFLQNILTQKSS